MLSQDTIGLVVIDTNELFDMLLSLDEPQRALVVGYIQGLAAKENVENSKK